MVSFRDIQHIERHVYRRTFMNEIVLFFTYDNADVKSKFPVVKQLLEKQGCKEFTESNENVLAYEDNKALLTLTSTGVMVNIPAKEYTDFNNTAVVWEHLGCVLKKMCVATGAWTFMKGNRFAFGKPVPEEKYQDVYKLVLSENLIRESGDKKMCMIPSDDKTCVFSCRYGMEKVNGNDALILKTMLIMGSYECRNLAEQVLARNNDMFDCWHWCVSSDIISIMEKED